MVRITGRFFADGAWERRRKSGSTAEQRTSGAPRVNAHVSRSYSTALVQRKQPLRSLVSRAGMTQRAGRVVAINSARGKSQPDRE
jgi:hypothetical protein